jgi:putative ABC transport system permease protein
MKLWPKLRSSFQKQKLNADMAEEMRLHLELQTEQNIHSGMQPDEARYVARRQFGGLEQIKEQCREQRSWVGLELLAKDARFALRVLVRQRMTTAIALLTIAICLGANSALFSVVRSTLLQPYPYPEPERVVNLGMVWKKMQWGDMVQEISPRVFLDLEGSATSYEAIGFIEAGADADVRSEGRSLRVPTASVTPGIWDVVRVQPLLGRTFSETDLISGGSGFVVLSHDLWRTFFASASDVIGAKIRLDDQVCEVIGVMPPGFSIAGNQTRLWRPKIFSTAEKSEAMRGQYGFQAIARLKPHLSLAQARHELESIHRVYLENHPEGRVVAEQWGETYGAAPLREWVSERVSGSMFFSVQAAAGLVLMLGCVNITGLLIVQAQRRVTEFSLRHAFGATRWRLGRQLAIETIVLFTLGGLLAAVVAWVGLKLLRVQFDLGQTTQYGQLPGFDGRMIGITMGVAVIAGIFSGSVPAFFAARRDLHGSIQAISQRSTSGPRGRRVQSIFVVVQVALALVLLAAAGVTVRNLDGMLRRGFGVAVDDRVVAKVSLPEYRYGAGAEATAQKINPFKERATAALKALPGVHGVTVSSRVPLSADRPTKSGFGVSGYTAQPGDSPAIAFVYQVGSGFFRTLGMTLQRGRDFDATDGVGTQPVAIISEQIAQKFFAGRDPIGEQIGFSQRPCRIIGVVREARSVPLNYGDAPAIYVLNSQWPAQAEDAVFVVHGDARATNLAPMVTKTLQAIDPLLTVTVTTMEKVQERALLTRSVPMEIAGFFAALSIVLMALGLYGVLANLVTQRTQEFGVRLALGAPRRAIFGMILSWGGRLTIAGISLGLLLCVPVLRWMKPLMTETDASAPGTWIVAAALVFAVSMLASYWPARRATKVDPMVALRCE